MHTLDIFLSSMPRLNPQVNIKNIVIGLMDRLSAYAMREKEYHPVEREKRSENEISEESMNNLHISSKDKESLETKQDDKGDKSETVAGSNQTSTSEEGSADDKPKEQRKTENRANSPLKPSSGIPDDVKLFEIFYEQVINLVKAQRLAVSETMALLLSLVNLAMWVHSASFIYLANSVETSTPTRSNTLTKS